VVHGVGATFLRAVECFYYAFTAWLPMTLLLPYWLLVGAGLGGGRLHSNSNRLHLLFWSVIVPSFIAVSLTIMHKRTGSFLLPACAVWFGLGVESLAIASRWGQWSKGPSIVVAIAIGLNLLQASRTLYRETRKDVVHPKET